MWIQSSEKVASANVSAILLLVSFISFPMLCYSEFETEKSFPYPLVEVVKHFPLICEGHFKCPFRIKSLPARVTAHFPNSLASAYIAEASNHQSACRTVQKAANGDSKLTQTQRIADKQSCFDEKVAALSRSLRRVCFAGDNRAVNALYIRAAKRLRR